MPAVHLLYPGCVHLWWHIQVAPTIFLTVVLHHGLLVFFLVRGAPPCVSPVHLHHLCCQGAPLRSLATPCTFLFFLVEVHRWLCHHRLRCTAHRRLLVGCSQIWCSWWCTSPTTMSLCTVLMHFLGRCAQGALLTTRCSPTCTVPPASSSDPARHSAMVHRARSSATVPTRSHHWK